MNDLIDPDLNIDINNGPSSSPNNNQNSSEQRDSNVSNSASDKNYKNKSATPKREVSIEKMLTNKFKEQAKEQVLKSWLDRYLCCFNWLKKYFQITSKDFISRVILSLIPFNTKFYSTIENLPDFYGPFWIYTLFIVLVSSCGSLTRTIQGKRDTNFFQEFIPTATILMYFIGFGVPIFLSLLSKIFGAKINVANVICVYGYSYTIFLPIIIVCSIPNSLLQWILLFYAIFSSTSLIIMSISKSFDEVGKGKKFSLLIIICLFQVIVFFVLKLYFFKHLNKELIIDNIPDTTILTNQVIANNTKNTNNTQQNNTQNNTIISNTTRY